MNIVTVFVEGIPVKQPFAISTEMLGEFIKGVYADMADKTDVKIEIVRLSHKEAK